MPRKKMPARKRGRPPVAPETREAIVRDLAKIGDEKMTFEEIATANKVSHGTVSKIYSEQK